MYQAVVIAKGDERAQFEKDEGCGMRMSAVRHLLPQTGSWNLKMILNDRRVFALRHEDGFFDDDAFDLIGEDGKGVEPEARLVFVTLRMNNARILVR